MMADNTKQRWSVTRQITVGMIALGILVGGFGTWSVMAQITGAVIASGQIEVDRNRQVIQHPDGGVVDAIAVDEGDVVEAGDLLIQLDPRLLKSELTVVEGQLFEILARRGRLEAERDDADEITFPEALLKQSNDEVKELIDGQTRLFMARKESGAKTIEQLEQRRLQIESQITGIAAQQKALDRQQELIDSELADQQSLLERGLAQASRVCEQITEIEIEILGLATSRREEAITRLRDLQFNELELTERQRTLSEQLDRLDIRAPVSGVVYGLTVFAEQSVVRPADPVMFLIPQDRPLVIAAQVQLTDVDQIYVGQEATMRFSAFDQRRTPELKGEVKLISADAFQDDATRASFYRVELELNEGEIERLPADMTLIPGMPVESFVRTADRSPIGACPR